MRYRDIIAEKMLGTTQLIYHASDYGDQILRDGAILGNTTCWIKGQEVRGLCLTRSSEFARRFGIVIFGLDLQAIRTRYRLNPYADGRVPEHGPTGGDYRREAEEFVVTDRLPIQPYLRAMWLEDRYWDDEDFQDVRRSRLLMGKFRRQPFWS